MPPKIDQFAVGEEPIDGYVLLDFLGRGQFGQVWKARDKASGRLLAIKIIDLTFSPTALKELRAFKLVKNLNHPNLIPIFTARLKNNADQEVDFELADILPKGALKELVIVMGLGEKSLSQRLKEFNPDGTPPDQRQGIPVAELIRCMRGAAKGIDFLNQPDHGLGGGAGDGPIIHCDIKPENMMIVAGEVQIADCGVAVIISPDMRQTRAAGSPAYSAPELSGNKPGPGTDQYALAISYYELRTGRLPFPDEASLQQIILAHALGDLDFSCPIISHAERELLRRATARVPSERFETCEEFVEELANLPEIRAAIRAARRTSSQANLSRPSDDFRLPRSGQTPIGTGSGNLPPTRKSDTPAAQPSDTPAARDSDAKPSDSPRTTPAPRLEPAPKSLNERDAGPAPRSDPTPWLPFPPTRPVAAVPETTAPAAPTDPPAGLVATNILPEILPETAPPAAPPTAEPQIRDTLLPPPPTETPQDSLRPALPLQREGLGMPLDPGDPLGKRHEPAQADTVIREIIAESKNAQRVVQETRRPTAPLPAHPPQSKAVPPTVAPPAQPEDEPSKPEWFKQAKQEEQQAQRKSGPVLEKKKSAPVLSPAEQWKHDADWKPSAHPHDGNRGKLMAAVAVGVIAVVGIGAGVWQFVQNRSDSEVVQHTPPATDANNHEPNSGNTSEEVTRSLPFDRNQADNELRELLAANKFDEAEKLVNDPHAPDDWREYARRAVIDKQNAAIAQAMNNEFHEVWNSIQNDPNPTNVAQKVKDVLNRWSQNDPRRGHLVSQLVERYDALGDQRHRGQVADVLYTDYPYIQLTDRQRKSVAQWQADDLLDNLRQNAIPAFQNLAVSKDVPDTTAREAIGKWLENVTSAAGKYGEAWPTQSFNSGAADVVRKWYAAVTEPEPGPAFEEFKKLAMHGSEEVAAVSFEYFRLARDTEPMADQRKVRNNARQLKDGRENEIDALFQERLARRVAQWLNAERKLEEIVQECDQDSGKGWAAAVRVEHGLDRKLATVANDLKEASKFRNSDSQLAAYIAYLEGRSLSTAQPSNAADRFVAAYQPAAPAFLKTPRRMAAAREVLVSAASSAIKPVLTHPPTVQIDKRPVEWLATVETLAADSDPYALVLCAIARKHRNDSTKLRTIVERLQQHAQPPNEEFTVASVPGLNPALRVLYAVAHASIEPKDEMKLAIYGSVAQDLIEWYHQECDNVHNDYITSNKKPNQDRLNQLQTDLLNHVKAILDNWMDSVNRNSAESTIELNRKPGYASLILAQGVLLAWRPDLYKQHLEKGWSDYQDALQSFGQNQQRGSLAHAALLAHSYFFYHFLPGQYKELQSSEKISASVWKQWRDIFRYADDTLKADPNNSLAYHVLAENLFYTKIYTQARRIHDAALANDDTQVMIRYAGSNRDIHDYMREYYLKAAEFMTRKYQPLLIYRYAKNLFEQTALEGLAGLDPAIVRQNMQAVERLTNLALAHKPLNEAEVHNLMGMAFEDIAWMTVVESREDFQRAIAKLQHAVGMSQSLINTPEQQLLHIRYLCDLGRCQYKAAVHGQPNAFSLTDAALTLRTAMDKLEGVRKSPDTQSNNSILSSISASTAETSYWLAMTHWGLRNWEAAAKTFRQAIVTFENSPDKSWAMLAVFDLARMTRERDREKAPKAVAAEIRQLAEELEKLNKQHPHRWMRERAAYLKAVAALIEGNVKSATEQFETLVQSIEKEMGHSPDDLLSKQTQAKVSVVYPYVYAIGELEKLWSNQQPSRFSAAVRTNRINTVREAGTSRPWILTVEERKMLVNQLEPIK
jgi:serine/threonine protein kinase